MTVPVLIAAVCGRVLEAHPFQDDPTIEDIRRLDAWAREEVVTWSAA